MSDLRIQYNEEMVGAGHPTKSDTLNRLFMGGVEPTLRDSDGKVLGNIFKRQTAPPETGDGEVALFCQDDGDGEPALFVRKESNGEIAPAGGGIKKIVRVTRVLEYGDANPLYLDLPEEVDPESSLVYCTPDAYPEHFGDSGGAFGRDLTWELYGAGQLKIGHDAADYSGFAWAVKFEVVEYLRKFKSVQYLTPTSTSNILAVPVDISKAHLMKCHQVDDSGGEIFQGLCFELSEDGTSVDVVSGSVSQLNITGNIRRIAVVEYR